MPQVIEAGVTKAEKEVRPRVVAPPFEGAVFVSVHLPRRSVRGRSLGNTYVRENGSGRSAGREALSLQAQVVQTSELLETMPAPQLIVIRHPETYQNAFSRQNLPKDEISKNLRNDRDVEYTVTGQWQSCYRTDRLAAHLLSYPATATTIYESNTRRAAHMYLDMVNGFDYVSHLPWNKIETRPSIPDNLINEQNLGLSDPYYVKYKELAHFYYDRLEMNKLPLRERFFKKPVQRITAEEKALIERITRTHTYAIPGKLHPYVEYPNRELLTRKGKYGESFYEVYKRALKFWEREKDNWAGIH